VYQSPGGPAVQALGRVALRVLRVRPRLMAPKQTPAAPAGPVRTTERLRLRVERHPRAADLHPLPNPSQTSSRWAVASARFEHQRDVATPRYGSACCSLQRAPCVDGGASSLLGGRHRVQNGIQGDSNLNIRVRSGKPCRGPQGAPHETGP
jgi:hypothetical protein